MSEPQQIGVQRLSMKVLNCLPGSLAKNTRAGGGHPSIRRVADDRMPDRRHMHADLMSPPGCKAAFDQACGRTKASEDAVAGEGGFAAACDDRHLLTISRVAADVAADLSRRRDGHAPNDRQVGALDVMGGESRAERSMGQV